MKIEIHGDIIPNDNKWVYDWLDMDSTCPRDVNDAITKANGEPLEVYINSGGGDIFAGSEIYTALKAYKGDVIIHIVGLAGSAASVIACARKSDITSTGMMMVHNVSSTARGDYHAMDKSSEILKKANEAIASAYVEKTGKSEADVLAMMDRETWLTGKDAVEAGLVDSVASFGRLVAAGPSTLPPQVVEKLKNSMRNPFKADNTAEILKAKAELTMISLKGEILK